MTCKTGGKIELGVGADVSVGKGKGEAVRLTARSGGETVPLDGVSRKSVNFEMTAAYELVKLTDAQDPLIQLLRKGKPVQFTGAGVKFTLTTDAFDKQFARFTQACVKN